MQILHLTDIHGNYSKINQIPELKTSDLVILSGDITHFGHKKDIDDIISFIDHRNVYAVTGNCDHDDVEDYLREKEIIIKTEGTKINNLVFIGLGGSLPCPGKTPKEFPEEYYDRILKEYSSLNSTNEPLILVTHQPPYKTRNDRIFYGVHVGSKSIRKFIENHKPLVCLTGHIHEGKGIDSIGSTKIVNPGPFRNGNYAVININSDNEVEVELQRIT